VIVYTVTGIDADGNAIKSEDDGARQQRTVQREPEAKMKKRILVGLAFCAAASPAFAEDGGVVGKLVTPNGTPIKGIWSSFLAKRSPASCRIGFPRPTPPEPLW
jgi:hypothetical protein